MNKLKYAYVLFFCSLFFSLKYFLADSVPSGLLRINKYYIDFNDLLNCIPVILLILFFYSSKPNRYNGIVVSICLVLISITFPLTVELSKTFSTLGQQNAMISGNPAIVFPFLIRYLLFILFFLVLAFIFFAMRRLAVSKLILFALLTVLFTNIIAVVIEETANHLRIRSNEKRYEYNKVQGF